MKDRLLAGRVLQWGCWSGRELQSLACLWITSLEHGWVLLALQAFWWTEAHAPGLSARACQCCMSAGSWMHCSWRSYILPC